MGVLLTVVSATLLISAVCSLLEASLYSTRVAALEAAKAEGRHVIAATRFLRMKRDISSPTSAILILNTIANTAGATIAGMYAERVLGGAFVPLFSGVLTVGILFFSEILPKTIGATKWKLLWPFVALPLDALQWILKPAIWVTRGFTAIFTRSTSAVPVTEDEIRASIQLGARTGELSRAELEMLESVFHFEDTTAREVMIPRPDIDYFDLNQPLSALGELTQITTRARYPVCRGSLDEPLGILHTKNLVGVPIVEGLDVAALVKPVPSVPETASIAKVLRHMRRDHRQMAFVVDEFGSLAGIITLNDLLEEIVGALPDEFGDEVEAIVPDGEGDFDVRGNVPIAKLNRELGLDLYDPAIVTLSGLLVSKLGRLVRKGDRVELDGALAEVKKAEAGRATEIRLTVSGRNGASDADGQESSEGNGEA